MKEKLKNLMIPGVNLKSVFDPSRSVYKSLKNQRQSGYGLFYDGTVTF